MMEPKFSGQLTPPPHFPTRPADLDHIPDDLPCGPHHRRAHSETLFRFPDDILLDDAVHDFDLDHDNISYSRPAAENSSHFRSLSVDADFFEGLVISDAAATAGQNEEERRRRRQHRRTNSMDGSSSATSSFMDYQKKALGPEKLAELSLVDPKRAKRILANRQSAARSKERKIRYTNELERKVQTLQTEATTLSAQVTMLQRDTTGLTIENKELKLQLQAVEQQAHLKDALNETLRDEVQRLKIATGQVPAASNGNSFSRALPPQFSSHQQSFHHFGNQQMQRPQQQHQLHMLHSTSNNNQTRSVQQTQPSFTDFNQRV